MHRMKIALAVLLCGVIGHAADWPQWLGPNRNGSSPEKGLLTTWPKDGPKVRWRTPIGAGYSGPAVAAGRVYVTDRVLDKGAGLPKNAFAKEKLGGKERILCLDEFSIAVDPVTTMTIEDVLLQLKSEMTIVLVTNLLQQARRLADRTMFLNDSEMIEVGPTEKMFEQPENQLTQDYVSGSFG